MEEENVLQLIINSENLPIIIDHEHLGAVDWK